MKWSGKHIDRFIKESLNSLEISSIDNIWQKLITRYSGLTEKQIKIDNNLKHSIENVESDFDPDSVWNGLITTVKTRKKRKNRLLGFVFFLIAIICCLGIFYSIKQNRETVFTKGTTVNQIIKKRDDTKRTNINNLNINANNYIEKALKQQKGLFPIKADERELMNQNVKAVNSDYQDNLNKPYNKDHLKETNGILGEQMKEPVSILTVIPPVLLSSDGIVLKPTKVSNDTQKILPTNLTATVGNLIKPTKENIASLTLTPSAISKTDTITKQSDSINKDIIPPHKNKNNGLKVGITFCPAYNLNTTTVNSSKSSMVHKDFNQINTESVKPGFGYSIGLILGYGFLNLNLKSQVVYTKINLNADYNYKNENIPIIDSATGNIISYIYKPDSNGIVMKSAISYSYLEIPLTLGYEYTINYKWGIRTDIGIYYLLQLDSKGSLINYSNLELTSSGNNGKYPMNKSAYGWSLGLGVVYKSKFLDYTVEPVYKKTLSSLYSNDIPVTNNITTLGLNISVTAKLKDIKNIFGIGKVNNQ